MDSYKETIVVWIWVFTPTLACSIELLGPISGIIGGRRRSGEVCDGVNGRLVRMDKASDNRKRQ